MIPITLSRINDMNVWSKNRKKILLGLIIPIINLFFVLLLIKTKSRIPFNEYGFSKDLIFPKNVTTNSHKGPWEK